MAELATADECKWQFHGTNEEGTFLVSQLAYTMRLSQHAAAVFAPQKAKRVKKISVKVLQREVCWCDLPHEHVNEVVCRLGTISTPEKTAFQMARIAQIVSNSSEMNGGLLVHGALAEWNGTGVIMAGPGGVGKTTASQRLQLPWSSLSDDNTLIVKAPDGTYWAHPWPTWSRFRQGDMCDSWDVQAAVKLKAIFMLTQKKKDRVSLLPSRQAISELVDVSGQSFVILANGLTRGAFRRINLMRFHNVVAISKTIPICRLEISRNGKFWEEIEKFLASSG
jgi:SynChlorMet cassette protein ScmC